MENVHYLYVESEHAPHKITFWQVSIGFFCGIISVSVYESNFGIETDNTSQKWNFGLEHEVKNQTSNSSKPKKHLKQVKNMQTPSWDSNLEFCFEAVALNEAPLCCPYVNELLKSLLVCVCQALIGLMKESGRSHMCCINSVIMGSCKSVFISVHWNNLAETAVEGGKKIVFISLCVFLFPLPRCRACTEIVRMPGNEWKKGSGITWGGVSSVSWG